MTGQMSSPDENYDRRHDLYHRRATFRNIRELDLTTLPVPIRYGAALFFQLSPKPVNLTPCLWQRPSRRATGTPQWVRSSRQTKILSANGDVYMLTAPGLQSLNRQVLRRHGKLPRHYALCLVECNCQSLAPWTTRQCRAGRSCCVELRPGMSVIPCAPIHSRH